MSCKRQQRTDPNSFVLEKDKISQDCVMWWYHLHDVNKEGQDEDNTPELKNSDEEFQQPHQPPSSPTNQPPLPKQPPFPHPTHI